MKKLKIGIMIKDFNLLKNWELRIIDYILKNDFLELSLLIKDGRKSKIERKTITEKISNIFKQKNYIANKLFYLQSKIERKSFKQTFSVDRDCIIEKLITIDSIELSPEKKGFVDFFSEEDAQTVKQYNLDLILRHEFNIIRGEVLKSSKYGIWSFHHGDNSINRGGPAGFWEIMLKEPTVGVTLQQLTSELDGGLVIDKAFFNRHWSFIKTNNDILEGSVSLLIKNINKLMRGEYEPKKSLVYYNPLYKVPTFSVMFLYLYHYYSHKAISFLKYRIGKYFKVRYECWTLFIGQGNFLQSTLFKLKPIKLPKNEFWADPFIFSYKNDTYIFFENYEYSRQKGKISCGKLVNNDLINIVDVLDLDYHLSFPFIFEDDGNIFLMPETHKTKRLEIYKCIEFPNKWELYSTAFENEEVADAFFHKDIEGNNWLFVNKKADKFSPFNSELYIYQFEDYKLKNLKPHKNNPVLIDARSARNAGPLFSHDAKWYRPSQANIEGVYGRGLNINEIKKLTIDEYEEETITTVFPNFHKNLMATHHLHQVENLFVIDAAYKSL